MSLGTFLVLKEESYETAYGQLLQLELPDGSSVTLNGNSSISYSPMVWKLFDSRKLKLTGEVFFDVAKKEKEGQSVKFQVLTRNLTIEVLGTRFNVIDRAGKESVVLEEGIVQLFLPQAEKPLEMLPGDYISYNSRISAMLRMKVQPEEYTSWKDKYIVLNNKTLGELAQIITSVYGKKVIFQNPGDKEIPLEGKVPSDEIKILITALHLVTKLDIKLKDDIVTISNSQEELTN
ncbi:hypothetical protein GCM10007049_06390 [Echinicola pacifica]|uniref:FecR family protein n=1 Tax=Echinicola pacifica TaxID=346377 RepID=A0A918PQA4_9BACT|nr:FecR domain-containing protein [Echinicola pacifica]GGZ16735.1 hypothetical protein GCM10007049_06390 [Echinicola pacifica]